MKMFLTLAIVMRWMHIFAAILAVGGSAFIRLILMPSAESALSEEEHSRLRVQVIKRWQRVVHTCILLFLVSGFYNFMMITRFDHHGQALYHALFGIKVLLALGVFAIAIALTSLKPWSADMRANAKKWMGVLLILAAIIVMISGVMKNMPKLTGVPAAVHQRLR